MPDAKEVPSPPSPLTMPCTVAELRAWLNSVDATTPGYEAHANVDVGPSGLTVS
jgi:hypothetical protein